MSTNLFTTFDEFQYPVENATIRLHQNSEKPWVIRIDCGDLISEGLHKEDFEEMCDQPSPFLRITGDGKRKLTVGSFQITSEDDQFVYVVGSHWSIIQACLEIKNGSEEHLMLTVNGEFENEDGELFPFSINSIVRLDS